MKQTRRFKVFAGLLMAAGLLLAFTSGCETDNASEGVKITPDYVRLSNGQSVTFTASGGFEYTWTFEDGNTTEGFLSSRSGASVTYTSNTSNALVRTLTVSSSIAASSGLGSDSNSNPFTSSAIAVIEHLSSASGPVTLGVSPSEVVLSSVGASRAFIVSGGSSYSWDLSNESIGTLSTRTGSSSTYTVLQDGSPTNVLVQTITITDSSGAEVEAVVKHN